MLCHFFFTLPLFLTDHLSLERLSLPFFYSLTMSSSLYISYYCHCKNFTFSLINLIIFLRSLSLFLYLNKKKTRKKYTYDKRQVLKMYNFSSFFLSLFKRTRITHHNSVNVQANEISAKLLFSVIQLIKSSRRFFFTNNGKLFCCCSCCCCHHLV